MEVVIDRPLTFLLWCEVGLGLGRCCVGRGSGGGCRCCIGDGGGGGGCRFWLELWFLGGQRWRSGSVRLKERTLLGVLLVLCSEVVNVEKEEREMKQTLEAMMK